MVGCTHSCVRWTKKKEGKEWFGDGGVVGQRQTLWCPPRTVSKGH